MSEYRVALEAYNGPLDLLLFLIKREEVDIHDIPIARITQEYVNYVELLKALDPEAVGDFLVLAATLMEIKSRMLLPKPPPEEIEEDLDDPRMELVRQLLEYKKFKDAASMLEDQADDQARRFPRKPTLPPRDPDDIELDNLELWDLFDAFNRMLEQTGKRQYTHKVEIDDTPIALHADDIVDALEHAGGETTFESLFTGRSRGEMIGLFLALLELAKRRRIGAVQKFARSEIYIRLRDPSEVDAVAAPGEDVPSEEEYVAGEAESDADVPGGDQSVATDTMLAPEADADDPTLLAEADAPVEDVVPLSGESPLPDPRSVDESLGGQTSTSGEGNPEGTPAIEQAEDTPWSPVGGETSDRTESDAEVESNDPLERNEP